MADLNKPLYKILLVVVVLGIIMIGAGAHLFFTNGSGNAPVNGGLGSGEGTNKKLEEVEAIIKVIDNEIGKTTDQEKISLLQRIKNFFVSIYNFIRRIKPETVHIENPSSTTTSTHLTQPRAG